LKVALWAAELAKTFWSQVGGDEPFPRHLCGPIRAMPLTVEPITELTVRRVCQWLRANGIFQSSPTHDRPLRGCLTADCGHGIVFLDAADPEDEQRFSLAHELAHFLRDYWRPRQLAIQRLGAQALDVLDGKRPPTSQERLGALLGGVPLGFHMHLMDRDAQRRPVDSASRDAEICADRLACELLAPAEHVAATHATFCSEQSAQSLVERLCSYYGLPKGEANRYACQLLGESTPVEGWLVSLRESLDGELRSK
jgi:hypothetical protein